MLKMKRADLNNRSVVVNILSSAFDCNKSVNFVVRQDRFRQGRIRALMKYAFNMCHAFGEVWLSHDEEATVLMLLPDRKRTTLRAIWWDIKLALGVIGLARVRKVLARERKIGAAHPAHPPGSFCYLWFIGVEPGEQNLGIGSRLLKEVILQCSRWHRPIYLETSVESNVRWYRKFGFEVYLTLQIPYTLYLLRRPCEETLPEKERLGVVL